MLANKSRSCVVLTRYLHMASATYVLYVLRYIGGIGGKMPQHDFIFRVLPGDRSHLTW